MAFFERDIDRERKAARERAKREAWALRASVWLLLLGVGATFAGRSFRERADTGLVACLKAQANGLRRGARCDDEKRDAIASADRLTALGGAVTIFGAIFSAATFRAARRARLRERERDDRDADARD